MCPPPGWCHAHFFHESSSPLLFLSIDVSFVLKFFCEGDKNLENWTSSPIYMEDPVEHRVWFKRLVEMISQNWKEKNRAPIINAVEEITLENIFFQRLNVIWELYSWHLNCIAWLSARETGHHFGSLSIMISSHICKLESWPIEIWWNQWLIKSKIE